MSKIDEKIKKLEELIKGLKGKLQAGNMLPSIKAPKSQTAPTTPTAPKLPGIAPETKKNPVKRVEQIQNKDIKDMKMREAREALNVHKSTGQWELSTVQKDESPVDTYHIHEKGVRITKEPLTIQQIKEQHGGVKKLEGAGFKLHQVKDKK